MSIYPQLGRGSLGTTGGVADRITDLERLVGGLGSSGSGVGEGSLAGDRIAPGTLTGNHLAIGAITTGHLSAGSITAELISAGAINAGHIQADAIQAVHIAVGTINADHISANTIEAFHIQAGTISATHISAGTIDAQHIQAGAIDAVHISSSTIVTEHLTAGVVKAQHIDVLTLSGISTDMGQVTAGTLTGATVQTSLSGSRVVVNAGGLSGYALDGTTKTFEINTGSGLATFTGLAFLDANSAVPAKTLTGFVGGGNMLFDSSFESTNPALPNGHFSGLSGVTAVKSTTQAFHGTQALKVTRTSGADPYVGFNPSNYPTEYPGMLARLKGKPVVFTAWVYIPAATSGLVTGAPDIIMMAIDSVTLNTSPATTIPRDTWTRVTTKLTIGGAAPYIVLHLYNPFTTGDVFFDGVQFEVGDAPTAYSPRADEILYSSIRSEFIGAGQVQANNIDAGSIQAQHIGLSFGGSNILSNSSFEDLTNADSHWFLYQNAGSGATMTLTDVGVPAKHGTKVARVVAGTSNASVGILSYSYSSSAGKVTGGKIHTASAWVKTTAVSRAHHIHVQWYSNTGALIDGGASALNSIDYAPASGIWERLSVTGLAPAGAERYYFYVWVNSPTNAATYDFDAMQLEEGEIATAYSPRSDEILPGMVGSTQLGPDSVITEKILAGAVKAGKIYSGVVEADRIQSANIAAGAITASKITVGFGGSNRIKNSNFNNGLIGYLGPYEAGAGTVATDPTYPGGKTVSAAATGAAGGGPHIYSPNVAVTPGSKVIGSVYLNPTVVGRTGRVAVEFLNAALSAIVAGGGSADTALPVGAWTRIKSGSYVVPAGAAYARTYAQFLSIPASEVCYWAAFQIEEGEVTSAWGLAPDDIAPGSVGTTHIGPLSIDTGLLSANAVTAAKFSAKIAGQNMISTATTSFEIDVGGWANGHNYVNYVAPQRSTSQAYYGSACMFYDATAGQYYGSAARNIPGPFRAGVKYTLSFYEFGNYAALPCGAFIGNEASITDQASVGWTPTGIWRRQSVTWTPTTQAATAYLIFRNDAAGANQFYIDAVQLEEGDVATSWKQHIAPAVIEGSTVTGATLRTAASGARVEISGAAPIGLKKYDGNNAVAVQIGQTDGLDLLAGDVESPLQDRRLNWKSGSVNTLAMWASRWTGTRPTWNADGVQSSVVVAGADQLVQGQQIASGEQSIAYLQQVDFAGTRKAALTAQVNTLQQGSVTAIAGSRSRLLLNDAGGSDFGRRQRIVTRQFCNNGGVANGYGFNTAAYPQMRSNYQMWVWSCTSFIGGAGVGKIELWINDAFFADTRIYFEGVVHKTYPTGFRQTSFEEGTSLKVELWAYNAWTGDTNLWALVLNE